MPTTQPGQATITVGNGRYFVIDNSWPPNGPRVMGAYETLRDAQNSFLSATDQQSLAEGVPFSELSSVQVV
jgi:hypothetical protein